MEHELLDLFYQRFDSFQVLWTIYSTVVLGIVATLVSFPAHLNSKTTRIILMVGFAAFSQANLGALSDVQEERINLLYEIKQNRNCSDMAVVTGTGVYINNFFKRKENEIKGISSITCDKKLQSKSLIGSFHYFQDFLVLLLIWILPKRLVNFQFFRSISNLEVRIKGSQLPNPIVSWDQTNRIWVLEEAVEVKVLLRDETDPFLLKIPKHFTFDLATIPRFLWVFIAPFELSIIAPLVHDYIYIKKGRFFMDENNRISGESSVQEIYINRLACDQIFLEHMKLEGIGRLKRYISYYGVRWFGGFFWKESEK